MGIMEVDMVVMVLVAIMIVDMVVRMGMPMCGGDGDHGSGQGGHDIGGDHDCWHYGAHGCGDDAVVMIDVGMDS